MMVTSRDHYIKLSTDELFKLVELARRGDERLYAWIRFQAEQKGVIGRISADNGEKTSNQEVE